MKGRTRDEICGSGRSGTYELSTHARRRRSRILYAKNLCSSASSALGRAFLSLANSAAARSHPAPPSASSAGADLSLIHI